MIFSKGRRGDVPKTIKRLKINKSKRGKKVKNYLLIFITTFSYNNTFHTCFPSLVLVQENE